MTRIRVTVEGRVLSLSNLGKVLYPRTGFTKGEVIDYYTRIAPVLLPHLAGRPLTVKRYPNGVEGPSFFEKNAPAHTPGWVRTERLPVSARGSGRETVDYSIVDDLPTLVYYANLAALELHVPMWRVGQPPDTLVFDLDPGPPATIVDCCRVALLLRETLTEDGHRGYPKTSGSKGMQLYVPWGPACGRTEGYAKTLAQRLEREHPGLVVSRMTRSLRGGKVLIDWSQNNPAKTTVAPYSLRGLAEPTVSTPIAWAEVESCDRPESLRFTAPDVLERVSGQGDLFAGLH
ncbi:non-homologous end-joining DNA ligase [Rhizohabitans arisaemae]|uniref:non-homologous end-joining DNA ligase n=1 Tax=Rhizohabitans arisaemae TaxID=2720610 RepID=UPI0024B1423E|nr:non-homologous end-joining DNA ligase [Rhizohabitans arisaemae]